VAEGAIGKLQFRSRNSKAFIVGRSKMMMWNMDLYQFRKVVRLLRRQCFKRDNSSLKLNAVARPIPRTTGQKASLVFCSRRTRRSASWLRVQAVGQLHRALVHVFVS